MWYDHLFPYTDLHDLNLDWILKVLKEMTEEWKKLLPRLEADESNIADLQTRVTALETIIDGIQQGKYLDFYMTALQNWIDANLQELVGKIVKYVWFGLTDDGHFCAYIPESWNFITFDTGYQYDHENYGHLLLYY